MHKVDAPTPLKTLRLFWPWLARLARCSLRRGPGSRLGAGPQIGNLEVVKIILSIRKPRLTGGVFLIDFMEARVGIEPTHKGFADLSLTTWVPRLKLHQFLKGAGQMLSLEEVYRRL